LDKLIRVIGILLIPVGIALIPLGVLLFYKHYAPSQQALPLRDSIESTVAALVGMIPEGLYLLTSIAIAASCLKLSKQRVLAQDMNCIETLAHVDVLCVDKTGTITEPGMEVTDVHPLDTERFPYERIEAILAAFYSGEQPDNETARAMIAQFGSTGSDWKAVRRIPFSSETNWSAADFGKNGCYLVGAPEFILGPRYEDVRLQLGELGGCRCLLLAAYDGKPARDLDHRAVTPIAAIYLSNQIRPDAAETFRYFASQGVSIRVISGDNPLTVSQVAARAGIRDAERYVDASTLKTEEDYLRAVRDYTVFGRVTPEQKRHLIRAFKAVGRTVAMTGDGVNDVLALKEADCGIAMASGSQAASQVAQLVLLDSQFSAMPGILGEGRRVINNIQRAAALFLVKNIFSFAFTILTILLGISYPLQSIQLTLISSLTIGIPSFFLALEPNYALVEGKFLRNVVRRAMPGGLSNVSMVLLASCIVSAMNLPDSALDMFTVWILATVGIFTLYHVSRPFTRLRIAVLVTISAAMIFSLLVFPGFFELSLPGRKTIALLIVLLLACPTVMKFYLLIFDRRMARRDRKKEQKSEKT
ncbi:MAG: HAD-IC family P-type ATPase, partial [Oscillospiraceae bacterium]|nr:HAD-IC family P-type ATPase [Oscillospiraceae bacterium]